MLDEKQLDLGRREQSVGDKEAYYKRVVEEAEAAKVEQQRLLEEVSGLTQVEAREILLKRAEDEVRHDMAKMVRNVEEEAKRESDRRATQHPLPLHSAHRRQPRGRHHRLCGGACLRMT